MKGIRTQRVRFMKDVVSGIAGHVQIQLSSTVITTRRGIRCRTARGTCGDFGA